MHSEVVFGKEQMKVMLKSIIFILQTYCLMQISFTLFYLLQIMCNYLKQAEGKL